MRAVISCAAARLRRPPLQEFPQAEAPQCGRSGRCARRENPGAPAVPRCPRNHEPRERTAEAPTEGNLPRKSPTDPLASGSARLVTGLRPWPCAEPRQGGRRSARLSPRVPRARNLCRSRRGRRVRRGASRQAAAAHLPLPCSAPATRHRVLAGYSRAAQLWVSIQGCARCGALRRTATSGLPSARKSSSRGARRVEPFAVPTCRSMPCARRGRSSLTLTPRLPIRRTYAKSARRHKWTSPRSVGNRPLPDQTHDVRSGRVAHHHHVHLPHAYKPVSH